MVSSILLSFKEKKLINKTDFCLEYEIIKQINYLFDNDLIDDESILPKDMSSFYYHADSFENYEFMKSSKMDEISKYIDDKLKIKLEEKLKKDSLLIINAIKENNIDDLTSWLVYSTIRYSPYTDKPILKYLDVDELLDVLKNTNNKIIRKFFHSLNKRYDFHIDELIDEKVFSRTSIQKIILPNNLKKIAWGTFEECSILQAVYIPLSVNTIENDAFENCPLLKDVYYQSGETQWVHINISDYGNTMLKAAAMHYYSSPNSLR